jgi:hypothetical protein
MTTTHHTLSEPAAWGFAVRGEETNVVRVVSKTWFAARALATQKLCAQSQRLIDPGQLVCVHNPTIGVE